MVARIGFKRMLLSLPGSAADYETVGVTVKLAELLEVGLVGLFAEDRSLIGVASMPCVREFRMLGGGWQPMELGQLAEELDRATARARRLFSEVARQSGATVRFQVAREPIADAIQTLATAEDIVVVIEPRHPIERVSEQFIRSIDAAFRASAAVMIVPSRVTRSSGPIAAVVSGPYDPCIATAAALAASADETLVVVGSATTIDAVAASSDTGLSDRRIELVAVGRDPIDASVLIGELQKIGERLIVISRQTLADDKIPALASSRSVPIMVIEPLATASAPAAVTADQAPRS
jgi:hypothetical protein